MEVLQHDLDEWLIYHNREGAHQGIGTWEGGPSKG